MKSFKKLGFEQAESAEIVTALNALLSNYQVHYQKLRNFHWNVEGADFFELHAQFEADYNQVKLNIDAVAERIRVFGKKPYSTLAKYLETSDIKEPKEGLSSTEMVKDILNDFEVLLSYLMDVANAAGEAGDLGTEDMIVGFIKELEKRHWMYSAFIAKRSKASATSEQ